MFTAALFIIAKAEKLKCQPQMGDQQNVVYPYIGILILHQKDPSSDPCDNVGGP